MRPERDENRALERGDALGRYLVLSRLGSGGMGVVYAAYDPDLDRKLAVKVLRPSALADEARLIREARAMARVQHPNVIAVYDVGTFAGGVFVAMELVDGATLEGWLDERRRDWPAVVDVFVQAGRGVAAAHAAGLVHRDFKPANVLIGSDGRVRVVDFGLARATGDEPSSPRNAAAESDFAREPTPIAPTETRNGTFVGTPSYMSPEQLHGAPVDARSDQFSFCVAFYRALFGERPFTGENMAALAAEIAAGRVRPPPKSSRVPAWLQRVVMQGLASRPEDRFATMDELLAALQHDPARIRRRWLIGGAIAVGVVALAALPSFTAHRQCGGAERKLAGVWDEGGKARVHSAFVESGAPAAEAQFTRVAAALDGWAREFVAAHADACEATRVRHEVSEDVLDLRMECLGQRLDETRAEVELLSRADAKLVSQSTRMVASMTSLGTCNDLAALRMPVRPPKDPATRARVEEAHKDVARGNALTRASKLDEAVALFDRLLAPARSTGYRPLEADVLLGRGFAHLERGKYDAAEADLHDCTVAARAGRAAVTEVYCWGHLVRSADLQGRYDEAERRGRYGLAAFQAIGASDERPLSVVLLAIGSAAANQGRFTEALDDDRRALAIVDVPNTPDTVNRAATIEAVARVLGDLGRYAEAEATVRRALGIYERLLGRESSRYASSLFNLAFALSGQGRYDDALAAYLGTVDIWERTLGREHPRLVLALTNIGDTLRILHRYDEALDYDRRALAMAEKTKASERDVGLVHNNIGDVLRLQHRNDDAIAEYRRAMELWQKLAPDHPFFVAALVGIGDVELDRGQPARALPSLQRALAIAEKHTGDPLPLADARFALARAEWQSGGDRARAHQRALAARATYAAAREQKEPLAAVDEWLAKH